MIASFKRKRLHQENFEYIIACQKKNSTIHNLSVAHKQGVPEFKENYSRPIPGPIEHNQGA